MTRGRLDRGATIVRGANVALCIVLAIGVMTLFPACGPKEDGTWMSCHYAQLGVCGLACAMAALSLVGLFLRGKASRALYGATAVLAVVAAFVPGAIVHLCMMDEMQCRAVMRPSVIVLSVVIVVLSLASALVGREKVSR